MDARSMEEFDNGSTCPPPSLVPRLHAVLVNRLEHNNPLLPLNIESEVEGNQGKSAIYASSFSVYCTCF